MATVRRPRNSQWYESNLLWGPVALGAGFILTVVAAVKQDLRWILWLAVPCFALASWTAVKQIKRATLRWSLMGTCVVVLCLGVYEMNTRLWPPAQVRIRILDIDAVPASRSGAPFPALNIYYDNAGTGLATGVANRFAAGFGQGLLSDQAMLAEQDKLLQWDGWKSAMDRRKQYEMHPGDPGEFTSIPNMEGTLAEQFRSNWDKVTAGTIVLYVFITFKYFEPSGGIGVTENCFWFSGGFARHDCGRGRTFVEHK